MHPTILLVIHQVPLEVIPGTHLMGQVPTGRFCNTHTIGATVWTRYFAFIILLSRGIIAVGVVVVFYIVINFLPVALEMIKLLILLAVPAVLAVILLVLPAVLAVLLLVLLVLLTSRSCFRICIYLEHKQYKKSCRA